MGGWPCRGEDPRSASLPPQEAFNSAPQEHPHLDGKQHQKGLLGPKKGGALSNRVKKILQPPTTWSRSLLTAPISVALLTLKPSGCWTFLRTVDAQWLDFSALENSTLTIIIDCTNGQKKTIYISDTYLFFYLVCSDVGLLLYICNWLHKSRFHCNCTGFNSIWWLKFILILSRFYCKLLG